MWKTPRIRLSCAALLCAALLGSPAAAEQQMSLGVERLDFHRSVSLAMLGFHYQAFPQNGPGAGFDAGISTCGFVSMLDLAVTLPLAGGGIRVVPRFGGSVLAIHMYGVTGGVTGGVQVASRRPGELGIALDVAASHYPQIEGVIMRAGVSYLWGGSAN